jgi:hypothetical protein
MFEIKSDSVSINALAFCPNGTTLAVGFGCGEIHLCEVERMDNSIKIEVNFLPIYHMLVSESSCMIISK